MKKDTSWTIEEIKKRIKADEEERRKTLIEREKWCKRLRF